MAAEVAAVGDAGAAVVFSAASCLPQPANTKANTATSAMMVRKFFLILVPPYLEDKLSFIVLARERPRLPPGVVLRAANL